MLTGESSLCLPSVPTLESRKTLSNEYIYIYILLSFFLVCFLSLDDFKKNIISFIIALYYESILKPSFLMFWYPFRVKFSLSIQSQRQSTIGSTNILPSSLTLRSAVVFAFRTARELCEPTFPLYHCCV